MTTWEVYSSLTSSPKTITKKPDAGLDVNRGCHKLLDSSKEKTNVRAYIKFP